VVFPTLAFGQSLAGIWWAGTMVNLLPKVAAWGELLEEGKDLHPPWCCVGLGVAYHIWAFHKHQSRPEMLTSPNIYDMISQKLRKVNMGRPATGDRKYEVTHIWDIHKEIMRLLVCGMKQVDIATHLGITAAMVSYTANSAIAKRQMELMHAAADMDAVAVQKRIQEIAPVALDQLEHLLMEGNEATRFKTATDILDRAGHGAVKTLRMEHSGALNKADIEEIKARAKEIGLCVIPQASVIDMQPEEPLRLEGGGNG
jgi:predicted transcriptional regulator